MKGKELSEQYKQRYWLTQKMKQAETEEERELYQGQFDRVGKTKLALSRIVTTKRE